VETDKRLRVTWVGRNNEGKLRKILKAQLDPHVCVGEIDFGHVDRAVAGIGVYNGVEEAMEGAAELHGLRRGLLLHGAIGATPRVVVDEAVSAAGLGDAADRAKPQAGEVSGLAPREEANVPMRIPCGQSWRHEWRSGSSRRQGRPRDPGPGCPPRRAWERPRFEAG
jgi:hypothetical protein